MERWLKSKNFQAQEYRLSLHHDLNDIMNGVKQCHSDNCWLIPPYANLLRQLRSIPDPNFQLIPVGLLNKDDHLIAGEIGYRTGRIYTSLTGFFDRSDPDHNHAGKLQMHLLAKHLEKQNFAFWNLGHPGMQYKLDLGAKALPRTEFLSLWEEHSS